jgi:gliding motility-associated-like protein
VLGCLDFGLYCILLRRFFLLNQFNISRLLLSGLAVLIGLSSFATHIVGGELTYTHLAGNTYSVTLTVYRDCSSANTNNQGFDDLAAVGIFNSNGSLYNQIDLDLSSAVTSTIPVALANPCFILPPNVCIERAVYTGNFSAPPTAGGYTLAYQRCCANGSVANISQPASTGATLTATIPGTDSTTLPNSAAVYNHLPSVGMCLGGAYIFDHSATDPDGDQLVYSFCNPLTGGTTNNPAPNPPFSPPYSAVTWGTGFNSNNWIPSNPAFAIDSQTGLITGTPTQLGQYMISICVSEYRNGVLLNTTRRTFQFRVTTCDPNIDASFPDQDPATICAGGTMVFPNNSTNASFYHWDFGVPELTNDTSDVVDPSYVFPYSGTFGVSLIANPGWPCADTAYANYTVYQPIIPVINVANDYCSNDNVFLDFNSSVNSVSPLANFTWDFGAGSQPATSTTADPQDILLPQHTSSTILLTVEDHGCVEDTTFSITLPAAPVSAIVPQSSFCSGSTYTFANAAQNETWYQWNFNTDVSADQPTTANPTFTFPTTGTFNVMLAVGADLACPDTAYMPFTIYPPLVPTFDPLGPQCLSTNSFDFAASGYSSTNPAIAWDFGTSASPASANTAQPQNIHFTAPGHYNVTVTIAENGCSESYSDSVWVAVDPVVAFEADTLWGCPGLFVRFRNLSQTDGQVGYTWNFGDDATTSTNLHGETSHTYLNAGNYTVSLNLVSSIGCPANITDTQADLITVHPAPTAAFDVTPRVVDILNPDMHIFNTSPDAASCQYFMSDGGTSSDCDFVYSWTDVGYQTITQYITNEYGCTKSIINPVTISGFLFFAPNAFSPDGDGTNEVWQPSVIGAAQYHAAIYNRWGVKIFESEDPEKPWVGNIMNGEYYAPNDIYEYIITIHDLLDFPHEYKGTIQLIR